MLEGIAMLTVLAGMGFYFVKSTDIPKDMKEKSAKMRATYGEASLVAPKKYAFDNKMNSATTTATTKKVQSLSSTDLKAQSDAAKLAEIEKHIKRQTLIALQNQKINELTLLITSLEQEFKLNNSRNAEIQAQIDIHLENLRLLKESVIA